MANVSSFSGAMPVIPGGLVEAAEVTRTTSLTAVAGTTFSGGTEIFSSDLTFVADGGPYLVEFFTPQIIHNSTNHTSFFGLSDGGTTQIGMLGSISLQSSYNSFVRLQGKYTPAAGAVTLNVRCWVDSGNTDIGAGAGTSTNLWPAFLRVSKIVNQNDGLKPFWTPPVVTQLPSQATVGDQVVNYTTNGAYQPYFYTGATDGWKQVGTSKPPMALAKFTANQTVNTATDTTLALDAATFQTDGTMVTSSGSNSKITVNTSGVYAVNAHITFDGKNTTGVRYFGLMKNGSGVPSNLEGFMPLAVTPSNSWLTFSGSTIVSFTSGDYINAKMYQSSGVNVTTVAGYTSYLSVQWIGPTP